MSLSISQITNQVVKPALSEIADFTGDITDFSTAAFQALHEETFLSALKTNINGITVNIDGTDQPNLMYDIDLNSTIFSGWSTIGDCINYLEQNQALGPRF